VNEHRMRVAAGLALLALAVSGCGMRQAAERQETVNGLVALYAELEFPEHFRQENPAKTGTEFDVQDYFTVLDHLSLEPGQVLDYVYYFDEMGGEPILYVRPAEQPSYETYADYVDAGGEPFGVGEWRYRYLDQIRVDGTEEGFFQFILLRVMGGQFYLYWHANYNDRMVVCTSGEMEDILDSLSADDYFGIPITAEQAAAARAIDLAPSVEMGAQSVTVRVVTFTKWGGFRRFSYVLQRSYPHTILDVTYQDLVSYDCGVAF